MTVSAESILTDVIAQSTDLIVTVSTVVVAAPATAQLLVGSQPLRMAMLVVPTAADTICFLAPTPQTLGGPVLKSSTGAPLLLHSAAYPLLISLPWFVTTDAADTITVYQVLRHT